ncbi:MAG: sodium-independent anion transporter, partial [Nonlabens sp.]|nr:sodium-independent anion transporter [Nonlabens sp.]
AVEDVMMALMAKNIQPLLVGVQEQPRYRMEAIDIIPDLIHEEFIFETYEECLAWVLVNVEDTVPPYKEW